jgi:hypothetical protein
MRALRRLLKPGGRIAYTTIHPAPGLDDVTRRRARRHGPRAVASRLGQAQLLRAAGFTDIDDRDVTPEFIRTTRAKIDERDQYAAELVEVEGADVFHERQRNERNQLGITEEGLIRRSILSASRPE